MTGDGYAVGEGFGGISKALNDAANALQGVPAAMPKAVDAGFSTTAANAALARVGAVALGLAKGSRDIASRVDAAHKTYHAAEHENSGRIETTDQADQRHQQEEHDQSSGGLDHTQGHDPDENQNYPHPQTPTGQAPKPPTAPTTTAPPPTGE